MCFWKAGSTPNIGVHALPFAWHEVFIHNYSNTEWSPPNYTDNVAEQLIQWTCSTFSGNPGTTAAWMYHFVEYQDMQSYVRQNTTGLSLEKIQMYHDSVWMILEKSTSVTGTYVFSDYQSLENYINTKFSYACIK